MWLVVARLPTPNSKPTSTPPSWATSLNFEIEPNRKVFVVERPPIRELSSAPRTRSGWRAQLSSSLQYLPAEPE